MDPQQTWMSEVLIVQAAMPAGVFALVVVKNYGEDTRRDFGQSWQPCVASIIPSQPGFGLGCGTNYGVIKITAQ